MGEFTPEMAWSYLLALAAWVGSLLISGIRYGGNEPITTPAQAIQAAAMFAAAAVIGRTAWLLTREAEPPGHALGPSQLLRQVVGTTLRWMLLCVGTGIPPAVRALRGDRDNRRH